MARHYALLVAAFALFVVYGSLVPFRIQSVDVDDAWERYVKAMSRPLSLHSRADWAANVFLFVPLGFVAAGAVAVDHRHTWAVLALIPAMTALSAALEFAQVWFPDRYVSIDDVVAESIGGSLGVAAWVLTGQWATDRLRAVWARLGPDTWAVKALGTYLLFLVVVHGMPFDLTMSPWQLLHKYKRGQDPDAEMNGIPRVALIPNTTELGRQTALSAVYFVPLGFLLALARFRLARGRILVLGTTIALGIEIIQLLVLSSSTYASDVVCGGLFVLVGWWIGTRWSRREVGRQSPNRRGDGA